MINQIDPIDNWHLQRWSKFTASENYKLLIGGNKNEMFGVGAMSYIKQKSMEMSTRMWERPELEEVKSLLHGKMYEYPAYDSFVTITKNYSMEYMGTDNPIFLEYEMLKGESGGSPDIVNRDNSKKIDAGAEIKCPKNPLIHYERLLWKDQWDIKENYSQCYCQIQNLMLITGAFIWYFISFDERQINKSKQCKIIEVKPDKKFQDNLDIRLQMAVKEKYILFNRYMN